jgi:ABC-2 type transport system ATP-binding protein
VKPYRPKITINRPKLGFIAPRRKEPKMTKEIAIEVKNLSKSFRLPVEQARGIKQAAINRLRGIKGYKEQRVLRDISFTVEKGDFFGIVGRNGSGKSTLLKLISNIYNPDSGSVAINGSLVSFIELGVGFNPELTGRENVYLNGALLGFSTEEVDAMYDDVVDFAELGEFMDQKLKNYSSGMQVRLAFSCAIRAKSDILVLDEVLAVGDEAFQRKCGDYFNKIHKDSGKTVVLVTHDMGSVRRYCNKAIMLERGGIAALGDSESVANQYTVNNLTVTDDKVPFQQGLSDRISSIKIIPVSKQVLNSRDDLEFDVGYETNDSKPTYIGISIIYNNVHIVEHNTLDMSTNTKGKHVFRYKYPVKHLNDIELQVTAAAFDAKTRELIGFTIDKTSCYFKIHNQEPRGSWILHERGKWKQIK